MENTVSIERNDLLQAHRNADTSGKSLLEKLYGKDVFGNIADRVKSFADVLKLKELTEESFNVSCVGLTADEIAYKKIKLIAEVLNEGWTPNWKKSNQYKYYPWFNMENGFVFFVVHSYLTITYAGSRLCFRSEELARYAATTFTDIYKAFFVIPE